MIDKDKVIQNALRKIGMVSDYNDNRIDKWQEAEVALDLVLDNVSMDGAFLFNATTVKLGLTNKDTNDFDEYRYNLPYDCLKVLRCDRQWRLEAEYIYSTFDVLYLQYSRKMQLVETPQYMQDYLIYALALELSENDPSYTELAEMLTFKRDSAAYKIQMSEGTDSIVKHPGGREWLG